MAKDDKSVLYNRDIPTKLKSRLHSIMVRLAMLYGMEPAAVRAGQERKMEVAGMRTQCIQLRL